MDQGEPEARWYWLDEDREWKKFMKLDSDLIEIASQSGDKVVKILGGLYEADIDARAYKKASTGFVRKIMRSTWFAEDSKVNEKGEKNCIPFMEDICQQLEESYLTEQFGNKIPVGLDFAVILARDGNHRQVHENLPTDVIRVTRGYKNRTVREATRRRDSTEYVPREQYSYGAVPSIQERLGSGAPTTAALPPLRTSPGQTRANPPLSPTTTRITDSAPSVRNSVFLEGYLHKLGEKFNGWDNRWFVLNADYLVYFSNKSRDKEKGRIALSAVQKCELAPPSSKHGASGTVFMLHTPKRTYQLRASSRRDAEAWVEGLNKNMRGESPNAPTAPVSTVDVKQVVSDDKGAVLSVQNSSRPLSGEFSKQVAVNPLQQNSAPLLGPQPIPLSQLPNNNSPYNNGAGNRLSMPNMSQPGQGQMNGQMSPGLMMSPGMMNNQANPGMQPMGGQMGQNPMMNPSMQPGMAQQSMGNPMGQNPGMMMNPGMMNNQANPGMQPMGNQMGQNPMMMNNSPGMQPMGSQMGQNPAMMNNQLGTSSPMMNNSPTMQRPLSQMVQNPALGNQMNSGMMNNQMGTGMMNAPMMNNNQMNTGMMNPGMQPMGNQMGQSPMMNNSPMQSPMMSHQPMGQNGTYQMAPQVNNPTSMMGQGQAVSGGQNYRLSQQYNAPMGQTGQGTMNLGTMGQMGQGTMGQPTMQPQGSMMNPQMSGQMGQMGTQGSMSAPMMGQNTMGQGMASNQASGWPPGYVAPPPPQSTNQYGNPSSYNQPYSSSPSQSPSMPHYTPSANNPFAQQVSQPSNNWSASYNNTTAANTGQYNPQSPSPYNNTGTSYGQPTQYQPPNPGSYGATNNQMYNYQQ